MTNEKKTSLAEAKPDLSYAINTLTSHAFHVANNTGKELNREQISSINAALEILTAHEAKEVK